MTVMAEVLKVTRHAGIAGQYAYSATVDHDGDRSEVTFTGSSFGGPIVMTTGHGSQVFVSEVVLDRIGRTLDADWVARFFA